MMANEWDGKLANDLGMVNSAGGGKFLTKFGWVATCCYN
jgi:hypothetical protein